MIKDVIIPSWIGTSGARLSVEAASPLPVITIQDYDEQG